jgi:hypothetical protein
MGLIASISAQRTERRQRGRRHLRGPAAERQCDLLDHLASHHLLLRRNQGPRLVDPRLGRLRWRRVGRLERGKAVPHLAQERGESGVLVGIVRRFSVASAF